MKQNFIGKIYGGDWEVIKYNSKKNKYTIRNKITKTTFNNFSPQSLENLENHKTTLFYVLEQRTVAQGQILGGKWLVKKIDYNRYQIENIYNKQTLEIAGCDLAQIRRREITISKILYFKKRKQNPCCNKTKHYSYIY